jgi:lysophospholipase L1-like esterase
VDLEGGPRRRRLRRAAARSVTIKKFKTSSVLAARVEHRLIRLAKERSREVIECRVRGFSNAPAGALELASNRPVRAPLARPARVACSGRALCVVSEAVMARSKLVRSVPLGVFSVLLAASAAAEPRKPTHFACVGDSITAGVGASSSAKNYPSLLQGLFGNSVQVKNFGHSGATMLGPGYGDTPYVQQSEYTAATDFVDNAGAGAVVDVIVILGANDSKPYNWDQQGKPAQYLKDYQALVEHFAGLSSKPVVYVAYPLATGNSPCCEIRGDVIHDQELPLILQLATEKHLPIIDLNTPTTNHPEYFGDGVHPNDAGYVVMANLVKKGLDREPMVAIQSPTMGATLAAGMVPLTATASADTVLISSVEFFEGQTSLGKVTAEPFTLLWAAAKGAHTLTAQALDSTLASATSLPVTFTVGDAAGGSGGSGGFGGASAGASDGGSAGNGTASGGTANGGTGTGGAGTAGASATNGGTGTGAGAGGAGMGGASMTPPSPSSNADSGCGCTLPKTNAPAGKAGVLLLAWLWACLGRRKARTRRRLG